MKGIKAFAIFVLLACVVALAFAHEGCSHDHGHGHAHGHAHSHDHDDHHDHSGEEPEMVAVRGKKGCPMKADGQVKDCPAFKEGCPYTKPETEEHKEKVEGEVTNCPAFKEGCPYAPKHASFKEKANTLLQGLIGAASQEEWAPLLSEGFVMNAIHSEFEDIRTHPVTAGSLIELIGTYKKLFTNQKMTISSTVTEGHNFVAFGSFEGNYDKSQEGAKDKDQAGYQFAAHFVFDQENKISQITLY